MACNYFQRSSSDSDSCCDVDTVGVRIFILARYFILFHFCRQLSRDRPWHFAVPLFFQSSSHRVDTHCYNSEEAYSVVNCSGFSATRAFFILALLSTLVAFVLSYTKKTLHFAWFTLASGTSVCALLLFSLACVQLCSPFSRCCAGWRCALTVWSLAARTSSSLTATSLAGTASCSPRLSRSWSAASRCRKSIPSRRSCSDKARKSVSSCCPTKTTLLGRSWLARAWTHVLDP